MANSVSQVIALRFKAATHNHALKPFALMVFGAIGVIGVSALLPVMVGCNGATGKYSKKQMNVG